MAKSRSAPPTPDQKRLAAQRAAAARERIQAEQRRRRIWIIAIAVGAVVVVVGVFVIVKATLGSDLKSGKKTTTAQQSVTQTLAGLPVSTFDKVGVGGATGSPEPVSQAALTSSGKPEILYIGAEYCPYCAGERWPTTVALSRFGTFHNLGQTTSSPSDVDPSTATLSFHGATYTSSYLSFVGKEIQSNQVVNGQYAKLDTLTAAQTTLFKQAKGIPYINFGGKYALNAVQYDPAVLKGKSQAQIAAAIKDPSTTISKDVVGAANVLSARVCQLTKQQPSSVCSSSGVQAAAAAVAKAATSGS